MKHLFVHLPQDGGKIFLFDAAGKKFRQVLWATGSVSTMPMMACRLW